jgi:hypothetical protein
MTHSKRSAAADDGEAADRLLARKRQAGTREPAIRWPFPFSILRRITASGLGNQEFLGKTASGWAVENPARRIAFSG